MNYPLKTSAGPAGVERLVPALNRLSRGSGGLDFDQWAGRETLAWRIRHPEGRVSGVLGVNCACVHVCVHVRAHGQLWIKNGWSA